MSSPDFAPSSSVSLNFILLLSPVVRIFLCSKLGPVFPTRRQISLFDACILPTRSKRAKPARDFDCRCPARFYFDVVGNPLSPNFDLALPLETEFCGVNHGQPPDLEDGEELIMMDAREGGIWMREKERACHV